MESFFFFLFSLIREWTYKKYSPQGYLLLTLREMTDFSETLENIGLLSHARCHIKEADQRLQSSPSNFIVLMTTSSSAGKESTCNAGDPGSIPGSGRCPGEGRGYPLQHSWASLVAQVVKKPPAMQKT